MSKKVVLAAAAGNQANVVDLLGKNLGPGDQAWMICDHGDCLYSLQGRCNIYMIHNVPKMHPGTPCAAYEKRA